MPLGYERIGAVRAMDGSTFVCYFFIAFGANYKLKISSLRSLSWASIGITSAMLAELNEKPSNFSRVGVIPARVFRDALVAVLAKFELSYEDCLLKWFLRVPSREDILWSNEIARLSNNLRITSIDCPITSPPF